MAEKKEKDNFWLYIGGIIVATILLVVVLKGRETEHLTGGYEELQQEVSAQMKAEGQNE
jgi:hypothetical protein